MSQKLKNRVVVITGASQGLGKALAETALKQGAQTVMCARRKKTLQSICSASPDPQSCAAFKVDVTNASQVSRFIQTVYKRYGRIDVLVNNAGWIGEKRLIENISTAEYKKYMSTNTDSIFYFTRAAIPIMKKQKSGLIINIASGAAKKGHGKLSIYSASKFAVLGLTQSLGWELQGSGVSCIAICPGGMHTPMRAKITGQEDAARQQSPQVVASYILQIIQGIIGVPNGGDISIRDGKITSINDALSY